MIFSRNLFALVLFSWMAAGCTGTAGNSRDPLEPMNRATYRFNDKADQYVMRPVAEGYRYVTPQPVRNGITNFFNNLGEVSSTLNYSLQGKPEPAFYSFARFTLNSTAGVLGFFDMTGEEHRFQNSVVYGNPHNDATLLSGVVGAVSARERLLGLEDTVKGAALDPYSYVRDGWLQIRAKTTGDDPVQSADEDINIDELME